MICVVSGLLACCSQSTHAFFPQTMATNERQGSLKYVVITTELNEFTVFGVPCSTQRSYVCPVAYAPRSITFISETTGQNVSKFGTEFCLGLISLRHLSSTTASLNLSRYYLRQKQSNIFQTCQKSANTFRSMQSQKNF